MILVMKAHTTKQNVDDLVAKLAWMNLQAIPSNDQDRFSIAIVSGIDAHTDQQQFSKLPNVECLLPLTQKFKLAGREFKKERTVISIKDHKIGGDVFTVIAGPCSIESESQIHQTAE